ncbi:hypothetical protein TSOC_013718 [Tetrabaena socialis]|uniref:Uncharacterized protein n=1 Tax=Tetrabaena socialis TaxID=47790 RepID=A0A2J7ZJL4_9CHLO|nr:hypothetical protein TSOC_013718 [Tetrabaena socialis]|eukprot:PNH00458.1 hypothetical protein TSOC_013718 [Tetrabaena socialis]
MLQRAEIPAPASPPFTCSESMSMPTSLSILTSTSIFICIPNFVCIFLDNERTPAEVKDGPLVVTAKPDATEASREGNLVTIPANLPSDRLLAALQPFLGAPPAAAAAAAAGTVGTPPPPPKRVHFTNPRLAFGGWSDTAVAVEYERHAGALGVKWCCRPNKVAEKHGKELHHQFVVRRSQP